MFQNAADKEWNDQIQNSGWTRSLSRPLVVSLKLSSKFQTKVELHRWGGESDIQFDDSIVLRKYERSRPGFLNNTSKPA